MLQVQCLASSVENLLCMFSQGRSVCKESETAEMERLLLSCSPIVLYDAETTYVAYILLVL